LASSTHGISSGQPYTVADDENTICARAAGVRDRGGGGGGGVM